MNFETFGPFTLKEWSPESVDLLYDDFDAAKKGLEDAIGVYIVACKKGSEFIPWYVGKTHNGFGIRFKQHFFAGPFEKAYQTNGNLSLFLIARVTSTKRLKKRKRSESLKRLKSIDQLEFALIGTCLARNENLLNTHEKTFHRTIVVPGYLNSPSSDRDKSAKALAKVLGTKG